MMNTINSEETREDDLKLPNNAYNLKSMDGAYIFYFYDLTNADVRFISIV